MTDANPFDDLSGVDNEDAGEEPSETPPESSSKPEAESTQPEEQSPDKTTLSLESAQTESAASISGPPFEYSEVRQRPLYARGETWDEFEDAVGISVVPELRRQGIRDEEKREIHDAVLTLAVEEPERLVEIIAERRQ